jgi:hypothetical protein
MSADNNKNLIDFNEPLLSMPPPPPPPQQPPPQQPLSAPVPVLEQDRAPLPVPDQAPLLEQALAPPPPPPQPLPAPDQARVLEQERAPLPVPDQAPVLEQAPALVPDQVPVPAPVPGPAPVPVPVPAAQITTSNVSSKEIFVTVKPLFNDKSPQEQMRVYLPKGYSVTADSKKTLLATEPDFINFGGKKRRTKRRIRKSIKTKRRKTYRK